MSGKSRSTKNDNYIAAILIKRYIRRVNVGWTQQIRFDQL